MRGLGQNSTIAGIQRLAIFDLAGTGSAVPSILVIPTMRKGGAKLTIKDDPIKDYRDRNLPGHVTHTVECEFHDVGDNAFAKMLQLVQTDEGAQVEVLSEHYLPKATYPSAIDGVYQYMGSQYLGLDFEYNLTHKERAMKAMLEANFPYAESLAIVEAATTNQRLFFAANEAGALPMASFDSSAYRRTKVTSFSLTDDLGGSDVIKDIKLNIKTRGQKNINGRTSVNYLEVLLEATLSAATRLNIRDLFELPLSGAVNLEVEHASGVTEAHNFAAGTLGVMREPLIGDEERNVKVTYGGIIPIMSASTVVSSAGQTINYAL